MTLPELDKIETTVKTDEATAKTWFETYLNWIIGIASFVLGAIVGHLA